MSVFLVQMPAYAFLIYVACTSDAGIETSGIGFMLNYAVMVAIDTIWALSSVSDLETALVSVERCAQFEKIDPETQYTNFAQEEERYTNKWERTQKELAAEGPQRKVQAETELPKGQFDSPSENPEDYVRKLSNASNSEFSIIKEGRIKFRNVWARYPLNADNVLQGLNFEVQPGEKIGVVGRTGSGKTSLIKVFWRCLDFEKGEIFFDGKDIKKCDLKVLRKEMDIISQETALFKGSLKENIDPEGTRSDADIIGLLESLEFKLSGKSLDMEIESDGVNLSLGERQILSFARVCLKKKNLILLDEATSNIDLESEKNISKIMMNQFNGSTMFIIAHRISTVMHCDKIMVLDQGELSEFDTPKALIQKEGGLFKSLYEKMMSEAGALGKS